MQMGNSGSQMFKVATTASVSIALVPIVTRRGLSALVVWKASTLIRKIIVRIALFGTRIVSHAMKTTVFHARKATILEPLISVGPPGLSICSDLSLIASTLNTTRQNSSHTIIVYQTLIEM